jgi:sirohydrochlorin cobaltochelatase
MMRDECGILLVAYGSPGAAAQKAPDFFEGLVRRTFPALPVYRAFTSESRRVRRDGDGKERDSVYKALCRMGSEGCTRVAVQSLHVVPGLEFRAMSAEIAEAREAGGLRHISVGAPLLHADADAREAAAALTASLPEDRAPGEVAVCVGHGGSAADDAYARLASAVAARDGRVLIGTLAGTRGVEDVLEDLRALCDGAAGRVLLVPLLAAIGKHAAEDIAGVGTHSWRGRIEAAGFDCRVTLKGLGEHEGFARIWLARLTAALNALDSVPR